MREASEPARNRNEWRMIVTQFWLASTVATGLPYRGNPVVGAVGELASMKQRKLWKTGEGWALLLQQWHPNSSLLEERSETPIVFVVSFVLSSTPQTGETATVYRYRRTFKSDSMTFGVLMRMNKLYTA